MMSKKQLACMLALHIVYLLVGASIFYHIESPLELAQRAEEKLERLEIQNLLYENYIPDDPEKQDSILRKLSDYCGKSMFNYTTADEESPYKWDFYHSFFFAYTVVSTIGYGNLAPTTHLSRILMIFYGLFGIPINGILLANLGEYFGLQLISVYRKYKRRNRKRANKFDYFFTNLGMLGQIFMYLIPGFLFFIFLPACIFVLFEGWDYIASIYYAFVTLTTIGFGDLVAGTINNGFKSGYFFTYQIFLIVWITFGLGYIVMLLGFITSGMRSESVHRLEQKLASQFRNTQNKILQGFTKDLSAIRKIINEANLIKIKPVYIDSAPYIHRSKSCPHFTFDRAAQEIVVKRKRANSESIHLSAKEMLRIQSDTDLLGIDKEKTFQTVSSIKPAELLARVVNVLGNYEPNEEKGIHMFSDHQILASEKPPIFSIGHEALTPMRNRALSVAVPNYRKQSVVPKYDNDLTWSHGDSAEKFRKEANIRTGKMSLPEITSARKPEQPTLARLFKSPSTQDNPAEYIKNTIKGKVNIAQAVNENVVEKSRKGSIFSSFGFGQGEMTEAEAYKDKTKKGRHSIFPTFDFSDDESEKQAKSYKDKTKRGRHSIFPTFDFDDDDDEDELKAYRKKTQSGRRSIFPTFDFSDPEDERDTVKKPREYPKRRHSIFPSFDFSSKSDDDEDIDEEELRRYQNKTKKGRVSLFPTFGRSKKNDEEAVIPESGDESEQISKPRRRGSLFPTFGKDKKNNTPHEPTSDLEASIRQFQKQNKLGRASVGDLDTTSYKSGTQSGRNSFTSDLENYKNRTKRGRGSLFDSDVNIEALPEKEQIEVLENTSVADLLRALAVVETVGSSSTGSNTSGLFDLMKSTAAQNEMRRIDSHRPMSPSLGRANQFDKRHEEDGTPRRRRISARLAAPQFTPTLATVVAGAELKIPTATAARENRMSMLQQPPPYTETDEGPLQPRVRRYSPAPSDPNRPSTGPIPRLFSRMRKESDTNPESESSRRGSLTDVVIDSGKDQT